MTNPLLSTFKTQFETPDFTAISIKDYEPAFKVAMARHLVEIDAIASNADAPTFANTIDVLEQTGQTLDKINSVFWNLSSTDSTPGMRKIESSMSPKLSNHASAIHSNRALFDRIDTLFQARGRLELSPEQLQTLIKIHTGFIKGGAKLSAADKTRAAAIKARLASLTTNFSQNVLRDETDWVLQLKETDLAALPAFLISAAKAEAESRKLPGYAITLMRSSVEPFLTFSSRRDLREQAFAAWTLRGDRGATDNKPLIAEILSLRAEYAHLLGYADFAAMKLSDSMAKSSQAAQRLLDDVWPAGKARAAAERDALLVLAKADAIDRIEPWDWRYYSEKLRQQKFDLDEATIKPYFQLQKMIEAAFDTATRLFGITFEAREDVPVYHPDVQVFEVFDKNGAHLALFYGDYFARPGKKSGAWMSSFRDQKKLGGDQRPAIINVMNFGKPASGSPALLTMRAHCFTNSAMRCTACSRM
jgi:peptidyl-dipeptidase Dcp